MLKTVAALSIASGLLYYGLAPTPVTVAPARKSPTGPIPIEGGGRPFGVPQPEEQPILQPMGGFSPVPPAPLMVRIPAGYSSPLSGYPVTPGDYPLTWDASGGGSGWWRGGSRDGTELTITATPGRSQLTLHRSTRFSPEVFLCYVSEIRSDGSWTPLPSVAPVIVWQP